MARVSGRRASQSQSCALFFVPRFAKVCVWLVEVIVNPLFGIDAIGNSTSKLILPARWLSQLSLVNETVGAKLVLRMTGIQLISILSQSSSSEALMLLVILFVDSHVILVVSRLLILSVSKITQPLFINLELSLEARVWINKGSCLSDKKL